LGNLNFRWRNIYLNNSPNISSDFRLKENIKPISYGLNDVLRMNPVQYNLIGVPTTEVSLGLIAQEIKNIIPEIVTVDYSEGKTERDTGLNQARHLHSLRYGDLIPVLIKAIQELEAKVASLEVQLKHE
jgi:hypothetical protein